MVNHEQPILEIDNLHISFFTRAGEIPAVMDFSLKVMPGEAMGLVGESGCGKSTVALAIMRDLPGVGRITSGTIRFRGQDMASLSDAEIRTIRGSKISMVYQEPMASLNPAMKIGNQLMEVPMIHEKASRASARKASIDMLKAVRLPDPERIMDCYPHQLSGGQQQRIVIAMALLAKPELLLLDEPTTALDVTVEAGIVQLVKELGERFGTAMLFISHNLGLVRETCDRLTVMYSGEAVETGRIEEVFAGMRHPYTQALFRSIPLPRADKNASPLVAIPGQLPLPHQRPQGCNFGPRCPHFKTGSCDVSDVEMAPVDPVNGHFSRCVRVSEIDWQADPVGRHQRTPLEIGRDILSVEHLSKHYNVGGGEFFGAVKRWTIKANDDISLSARQSEILAIVGESGCGKSTLAKVLLGLETATKGQIQLDGKPIGDLAIAERDASTISTIQMIFQNPFDTLNPSQSVGSQIIRTLEKFRIGSSNDERRSRMLDLLDLVKLPRAFEKRMPRQLSGGQKQRIGIARAFAARPAVVIADEPMSALDVSVQASVTELLMDVQRDAATTMLFISHDLGIVRYLADRIIVMYLGHIVEQGTTREVFSAPYHPYTEALLSAVPIADIRYQKRDVVLEGEIPSATNPPAGCPFQTRCRYKASVPGGLCERELPPLKPMGGGHAIRCHLPEKTLNEMEPVIREVAAH